MADTGHGTTIAFATTTGFTPAVLEIELPEFAREALEDTVLNQTGGKKTYIPDDLYDPGETRVRFQWDQSAGTFPPISAAAESITVTFGLKSGESTAATLAGTGFLINSGGVSVVQGEIMEGEFVIKWDGKTGPTFTAGS